MRSTQRTLLAVMAVIAVAGVGAILVLIAPGQGTIACPADARIDAPTGWFWQRDAGNDCAWTLYDRDGQEAPAEIYEAHGESPPPANDSNLLIAALVVMAVAAVGSRVALVLWRTRKDTSTTPTG